MDPNNSSREDYATSSSSPVPRTSHRGTTNNSNPNNNSNNILLRNSQQQHHHHVDAAASSVNRPVSVLSLSSSSQHQQQQAPNIIGRRSSSQNVANDVFPTNNTTSRFSTTSSSDVPLSSAPLTAQQRLLQMQNQHTTTMNNQQQQQFRPIQSRTTPPARGMDREPTPPGEDAPATPPSPSASTGKMTTNMSGGNQKQQQNFTGPSLDSGKVSLVHHQQQQHQQQFSSLPQPPSKKPTTTGYEDMNMFNSNTHQSKSNAHSQSSTKKNLEDNFTTAGSSSANQYYQPTVEEIERNHQRKKEQQRQDALNNKEDDANATSAVDDAVFVRECVFAMLASCETLQFSSWDTRREEYSPMPSKCGASPRQRDIYERFALKLGTMRRKISILLNGPTTSFLQQSLRRSVERQLVSYSRFISSLNEGSSMIASRKQRSISDVQVAFLRAMPKLSALYSALQHAELTKGGELVSKLEALNHHGGEELSRLLHDVYRETVMPLLYMTLQWLTKGSCSDPYSEFFVSINNAVPESSDKYWSEKFSLQLRMIPSTFTREQSELILLVGKNINFLQKCCRVRDWRMNDKVTTAAQDATFDSVDSVIRAAVVDTNASVLKTLNEKFLIVQAFQRARLVFLLANGDFANVIMEKLDPHLSHPANLVSTTAVQDALHNAISSLSAILPACMQQSAPHIAAEINIPPTSVQQDGSSGSSTTPNSPYSGWDVFSMSLPFPPPYNTFFTTETIRTYRKLFRLLWKVKRAEVELKKAWQLYTMADRKFVNSGRVLNSQDDSLNHTTHQNDENDEGDSSGTESTNNNNTTKKRGTAGRKPKPKGKKATTSSTASQQQETEQQRRLRQMSAMAFRHLTHFVTNFQMYLVTEVIEVAWQKLTQDLAHCTSVDDIIAAHNAYLNSMLKYALVRSSSSSTSSAPNQGVPSSATSMQSTSQMMMTISNLLNKMLNVALEFCASYDSIVKATYSHQQQAMTASNPLAVTPSVNAAIQRCQRTITTIETGINEFLNILEEDDARGGQRLEFLNSLASRLNFNFFYGGNDRSSSVGSTMSSGGGFSAARSGRLF